MFTANFNFLSSITQRKQFLENVEVLEKHERYNLLQVCQRNKNCVNKLRYGMTEGGRDRDRIAAPANNQANLSDS